MKSVLKLFAVAVLLIAAAVIPTRTNAQFFVMENPLLNKKAPDFTLNDIKGNQVPLAQFFGQKPTILFFWATWCPHCRTQLKELNKSKDAIAQKGINLVTIDVGENVAQVNKYVKQNNIELNILLDESQDVGQQYGLVGVPTFFFIDAAGIIKGVEHALPQKYEDFFTSDKK